MFTIQFLDGEKITAVYRDYDLERFKREGFRFEIIKPQAVYLRK
jgi:hypothetical protein